MINKDEQRAIEKYLTAIGINTMEFFEEMYDHICSSFENRIDKSKNIKAYIKEVVQPGFGGVKGIHKIRDARTKSRIKLLRTRFGSIFIRYFFGWPNVLITILVVLGSILIEDLFGPKVLFTSAFIFAALLPIVFFFYKLIVFRIECKKNGKPYRISEAYNVLTPFGSLLINVPNMILQFWNITHEGKLGESFFGTPQIVIPISIFMILCFLTLKQLYNEEFKIEIQLSN